MQNTHVANLTWWVLKYVLKISEIFLSKYKNDTLDYNQLKIIDSFSKFLSSIVLHTDLPNYIIVGDICEQNSLNPKVDIIATIINLFSIKSLITKSQIFMSLLIRITMDPQLYCIILTKCPIFLQEINAQYEISLNAGFRCSALSIFRNLSRYERYSHY